VTVLFADLEGSTELIRDRDPEAAQKPQVEAALAQVEGQSRRPGMPS
jgi:hypothetical protein